MDIFTHRLAEPSDIEALRGLMNEAIRELLPEFLTLEQVQASFAIMGLDTVLIDDGTYFIIEGNGELAGCGGWSRRATLFGGNHTEGRDARLLDPCSEPARVRAMYTSPRFVRRGVGRRVLALCEEAARAEGFSSVELAATMGGKPLYEACGYRSVEAMLVSTPNGVKVPLLRMKKSF
jgi:GNAT superfamily N-acetyltransferase